jgi:hypothetical protein
VSSSWIRQLPICTSPNYIQHPKSLTLNIFGPGGRAVGQFFFFFFLGPACFSSGSTSASKAYCAYPKLLTAQIHYPCVSYKETEVPNWGCAYFFWFHNRFPKNIIALSSQCLAAADDMLHCFNLHPAKSAGWIPTVQAHSLQMSSHWSMSSENCNCHFSWCLPNLSRSSALFLHGLSIKSLPCLQPGTIFQVLECW